jgi:putative transposase
MPKWSTPAAFRTGHLWQNRFYSCPLSPSHLLKALAYIECPEAYPWSSAAAHLGLAKDRARLLDMDFWRNQGGASGWLTL